MNVDTKEHKIPVCYEGHVVGYITDIHTEDKKVIGTVSVTDEELKKRLNGLNNQVFISSNNKEE